MVSGFKDLRFVYGREFPTNSSTYEDFAGFASFMRLLCKDVRLLLNSRATADPADNKKLEEMLVRDKEMAIASSEDFGETLATTHAW